MKTLTLALSLLTLTAHAAIPKRGDLTAQNWCTKRPSEERMDKLIFKSNGQITIQTFHSTSDVEKITTGTWKLEKNKLRVHTEKRPAKLTVTLSEDGQTLNFSTGTKAVACN